MSIYILCMRTGCQEESNLKRKLASSWRAALAIDSSVARLNHSSHRYPYRWGPTASSDLSDTVQREKTLGPRGHRPARTLARPGPFMRLYACHEGSHDGRRPRVQEGNRNCSTWEARVADLEHHRWHAEYLTLVLGDRQRELEGSQCDVSGTCSEDVTYRLTVSNEICLASA